MTGFNFFRQKSPDPVVDQGDKKVAGPSIPADVSEDVREAFSQALFLVERSPRASGALSRYCLQQIVRDFWKIPTGKQGTLTTEFNLISGRMSEETLSSIDCVRQHGTIDTHFSKDRDMMVETTVDEARMLIALVQLLIQEWFVERHNREKRLIAITRMAAQHVDNPVDEAKLDSLPCSNEQSGKKGTEKIKHAQSSGYKKHSKADDPELEEASSE